MTGVLPSGLCIRLRIKLHLFFGAVLLRSLRGSLSSGPQREEEKSLRGSHSDRRGKCNVGPADSGKDTHSLSTFAVS